jgi:hypothetical protein
MPQHLLQLFSLHVSAGVFCEEAQEVYQHTRARHEELHMCSSLQTGQQDGIPLRMALSI